MFFPISVSCFREKGGDFFYFLFFFDRPALLCSLLERSIQTQTRTTRRLIIARLFSENCLGDELKGQIRRCLAKWFHSSDVGARLSTTKTKKRKKRGVGVVKGRPNNHYPPLWHCSSLSCLSFYLYFDINWTFATSPLVTRKVNLRLDRRPPPPPRTRKRIMFSAREEHGCSRWRGKPPFSLLLHHHHHHHFLSYGPKQPANSS